MNETLLNAMLANYVATALWSSTDDDGKPLDASYNMAPEALATMREDCKNFYEANNKICSKYPTAIVAHDFWLTRNRHGAGFWDGDYSGDDGRTLTQKSHEFGTQDIYIGDDSLVYIG